jgi:hypothetical protein
MYKSVTRQQRMGEQSRLSMWPEVNVLTTKDVVKWNILMQQTRAKCEQKQGTETAEVSLQ